MDIAQKRLKTAPGASRTPQRSRRSDERTIRQALKRLRRHAKFYRWGGMGPDVTLADHALEALDRMGERLDVSVPMDQPRLKGLEEQ